MRRRDLLKLPALAIVGLLPLAPAAEPQWKFGMDFNEHGDSYLVVARLINGKAQVVFDGPG